MHLRCVLLMASITDPTIAGAIRLLMADSTERRNRLQDELDLADQHHAVVSALHDLLIDAESRVGKPLRSVS